MTVLSGAVIAAPTSAGDPPPLQGTDLLFFLLVAFWPVQVCLALLVYRDAGFRGVRHRARWIVLGSLPVIGYLLVLAYYVRTRWTDRRMSRGEDSPREDGGSRRAHEGHA